MVRPPARNAARLYSAFPNHINLIPITEHRPSRITCRPECANNPMPPTIEAPAEPLGIVVDVTVEQPSDVEINSRPAACLTTMRPVYGVIHLPGAGDYTISIKPHKLPETCSQASSNEKHNRATGICGPLTAHSPDHASKDHPRPSLSIPEQLTNKHYDGIDEHSPPRPSLTPSTMDAPSGSPIRRTIASVGGSGAVSTPGRGCKRKREGAGAGGNTSAYVVDRCASEKSRMPSGQVEGGGSDGEAASKRSRVLDSEAGSVCV